MLYPVLRDILEFKEIYCQKITDLRHLEGRPMEKKTPIENAESLANYCLAEYRSLKHQKIENFKFEF